MVKTTNNLPDEQMLRQHF